MSPLKIILKNKSQLYILICELLFFCRCVLHLSNQVNCYLVYHLNISYGHQVMINLEVYTYLGLFWEYGNVVVIY